MLNHLHVLVTRPEPAGAELCQLIQAQGGKATHLPTITFTATTNPNQFQHAILTLPQQDWVIWTSPQAVYSSMPLIQHHWPILPQNVQFAAIGASTAHTLNQINDKMNIIYPHDDWSSEGLLRLSNFQSIAQQRIMIVRGQGGRDKLHKILSERGAIMTHVIAYKRTLPTINQSFYVKLFLEKQIDVIIATSNESIENLKKLFDDVIWQHLQHIPVLVVSDRIKHFAYQLGFTTIRSISCANNQKLIGFLKNLKQGHRMYGR